MAVDMSFGLFTLDLFLPQNGSRKVRALPGTAPICHGKARPPPFEDHHALACLAQSLGDSEATLNILELQTFLHAQTVVAHNLEQAGVAVNWEVNGVEGDGVVQERLVSREFGMATTG